MTSEVNLSRGTSPLQMTGHFEKRNGGFGWQSPFFPMITGGYFSSIMEKKNNNFPLMFCRHPWRLELAILEISAPPEAEV